MKKRKYYIRVSDVRVNIEKDYSQDQLVFQDFLYQVLPEI